VYSDILFEQNVPFKISFSHFPSHFPFNKAAFCFLRKNSNKKVAFNLKFCEYSMIKRIFFLEILMQIHL